MKYKNGEQVKLRDKVLIDGKYHGEVVANMDGPEYSEEEPEEKWGYLGSGVMINTDFGGLVHYQQESLESEEIELLSRG
jgi:hypothetical protein